MILQDVKISIPFIDLEELPHSEKEKTVNEIIEREANFAFDFSQAPYFE